MTDRPLQVGDVVEVDVESVAHGGHCVARYGPDRVVLFVRHTLPGERVRAQITELGSGGRFLRADAIEILTASADRVEPPCPFSGPGRCGGCDWQHVSVEAQRRLKAAVVAEQLARLAGLDPESDPDSEVALTCDPVPGDEEGLRWRTRVEFAVSREGQVGLRAHRSHEVIPLTDCPIAHEGVIGTGVLESHPPAGVVALDVVAPSRGEPVVVPLAPGDQGREGSGRGGDNTHGRDGRGRGRGDRRGRDRGGRGAASRRGTRHTPRPVGHVPEVTEQVGQHEFTLSARGFWQVHPGAATTFTEQVLAWLDPRPGERALDLYSGVGLFAVPLAEAVGPTGSVLAVEADRAATQAAAHHLATYPWARAEARPTLDALRDLVDAGERADVIVLDPPRSGAGREVMELIARLGPRAVVYVACDPAALARDLRTAQESGMALAQLRAFDAFPMTHHVECVALLVREVSEQG
ncbi:class I SAM-dependent RNA methyltransferase [Ornithinimicrobium sp. Y1694]|uniref:class I SAM-dependent RNA methyltransferase n=1 Tax=Ornithinimicrobium sp. Y1694 TaxID=3418590 RepID=UPI003CF734B4